MRDPDLREYALACLKLADGHVERAREFLAFITGEEDDKARAKLAAVREAVG